MQATAVPLVSSKQVNSSKTAQDLKHFPDEWGFHISGVSAVPKVLVMIPPESLFSVFFSGGRDTLMTCDTSLSKR